MTEPVDVKAASETVSAPEKTKLPMGFQPWMIAAALALGAGVVIGIKLGQALRGPQLPVRQPCADCARRTMEAAREAAAAAAAAPRPAPPVVQVPEPPATNGPQPDPEPIPSFSAQGQAEED